MTVDPDRFRSAVSRFPTGVTVITADAPPWGAQALTANSFTSVSLDPLLVLVCIQRSARFHEAILTAGQWAISVLAADQVEISRTFAVHGRPWTADQFEPFRHEVAPRTGCVVFTDSLVTLECRTWSTADGGDHTVVVGEVLELELRRPDAAALIYVNGAYRAPAEGSRTGRPGSGLDAAGSVASVAEPSRGAG